jgi:hypothetical protein
MAPRAPDSPWSAKFAKTVTGAEFERGNGVTPMKETDTRSSGPARRASPRCRSKEPDALHLTFL